MKKLRKDGVIYDLDKIKGVAEEKKPVTFQELLRQQNEMYYAAIEPPTFRWMTNTTATNPGEGW